MLNKLILNNHIISSKKKIEQARVQTINKLVQKIRKLTALSQKQVDKARIDSNLKRVLLILGWVKKLKAAEIIRRVLTLHKKPTAVLTNGQANPFDVAVALLASNKIIDDIAKTLISSLHLNDKNPGWREEIMEPSKKKKMLQKNTERKKQNSKSGDSSKNTTPRGKPSWKEENTELDSTENSKTDENEIATDDWKVEPVNDNSETQDEALETEDNNNSIGVPRLSTVDSFFFTITGENYMSSVVFKRKQPEAPNNGPARRERRQHNKGSNYQKRRSNDRQGYSWCPEKSKLHPTKKKQAGIEFKGRKIRFEDEPTRKVKPKSSAKRSHTQGRAPDQNVESLHPSWAAKQKLKPAITLFKGTKIKFDD